MSERGGEHPGKIGQLNGKWALLFKVALASYPFVIAWAVWMTHNQYEDNAFRMSGERFTKTDALVLKESLIEKINAAPSTEWRERIADIDKRSQETLNRLIRIEAVVVKP